VITSSNSPDTERILMKDPRRQNPILLLALLAGACSGGSDATAPPENGFRITLSSSSPAIPLNSSALVTINVQRLGDFVGPVDLTLANVATGISVFVPEQIPADMTSADLLIIADADATAGSRAFTIVANGAGAPARNVTGSVTIGGQPTLGFTFEIDPASVTVGRGQSSGVGFTVTRGPGANAPLYVVTGPRPAIGLVPVNSAGQAEYPVVSNNGAIIVSPDVSVANGVYPVVIAAPLPGAATQRVTLTIAVVDPS
jgi:hypothetical protein